MNRLALPAAVVGMLVLAACGQADSTSSPSQSQSPSLSAEEAARATLAEHDQKWPEIAAECAGDEAEDAASDGQDGQDGGESGGSMENPKHAENDAYRQTLEVPPGQQCRGEAHAARIAAAMTDEDGAFGSAQQMQALLTDLGYPSDSVTAREAGTGVAAWDLVVSGAGPCISGHTGTPDQVEVHGVFMEGGCAEPQGGH